MSDRIPVSVWPKLSITDTDNFYLVCYSGDDFGHPLFFIINEFRSIKKGFVWKLLQLEHLPDTSFLS